MPPYLLVHIRTRNEIESFSTKGYNARNRNGDWPKIRQRNLLTLRFAQKRKRRAPFSVSSPEPPWVRWRLICLGYAARAIGLRRRWELSATAEAIEIKVGKMIAFRPAKKLKEAI